jgi:choline dehydrogenase
MSTSLWELDQEGKFHTIPVPCYFADFNSGPLAANLARAGHSVLVLEAGDDQTENVNVSQWLNFNLAGNDPATRWDFFVKHSDDEAREARYLHRTWRKTDGSFYVGIEPPAGAKPLGIVSTPMSKRV